MACRKNSPETRYSNEDKALETAGGIIKALPLLGNEPFLVVNGDIWCDYDFSELSKLNDGMQAHLILIENPPHNKKGDFALSENLIKNTSKKMYTFSGIGLYSIDFFSGQKQGAAPLAPIIRNKCENNFVSGEIYNGRWTDVGTIERLQKLEKQLT